MKPESSTVAPLRNVAALESAIRGAQQRPAHLPGIVPFYGPSGWGKSSAAAFCCNRFNGYYVQCQSTWNGKNLLTAILHEMGIAPERTAALMAEQAAKQLAKSERPLIVDEFDYLVEHGRAVDLVRDLHEFSAGAVIVVIGEERLPLKLKRYERFHGRAYDWVPAHPANAHDAGSLAKLYCPGLQVGSDLLARLAEQAKGSVRRICVNLDRIARQAKNEGLGKIGVPEWGNRPFWTGEAPARSL